MTQRTNRALRAGLLLSCLGSVALAVACGDDEAYAPVADGGALDAAFVPEPPLEAGPGPEAGGDSSTPRGPMRVLTTFNGPTSSELVVLDRATGRIEGRLGFPGFLGTTYVTEEGPFLLEQAADVVARLDPDEPWKITASYGVALQDRPDGGDAYANPAAVVVPAAGKAYVLRYTRNQIAVLDLAVRGDAAAPSKTIDLSAFVHPDDSDGVVEPTAATWVPEIGKVVVLLGRVDRKKVVNNGFDILCTAAKPLLVAIDPRTDAVVPVTDGGAAGGIELPGYNSVVGARMVRTGTKLHVLQAGCKSDPGDGGLALGRRGVDEVDVATGSARIALDLVAAGFPSSLVDLGDGRAVVGFFGEARLWALGAPALGQVVPDAPEAFAFDRGAHLVGTRSTFLADGGSGPTEVIETPLAATGATDAGAGDAGDGGVRVLATAPSTLVGAFVGGVEVFQR